MSNLKVGLIGTGNMGQNHLRILSMMKDVDLVFIYDLDFEKTETLAKLNNTSAAKNLEDALKTVDAIIIATPTSTHFEYIKRVSALVKNIFVEKPLTDSLATSQEVLQLVKQKDLKIQVGFIERFNPAIVALKSVLKKENVINIDFSRTNKLSSRITDVDVIMDLMIHDIDLALFLSGAVDSVQAYGVEENNFIAFAKVTLRHKNGAFSNITASRITEKRIRHISVTCRDTYIDCNLLSKEVNINKQTIEQYNDDMSISSQQQTIDIKPQEALLSELLGFVSFVQEGQEEGIPVAETAFEAIKIIDEIYRVMDVRKLS
jgi:predicted dehydrogenase